MKICFHSDCNNETSNPKFCCQSCSSKYNNIGKRRHGVAPANCPCGAKLSESCKKYCSNDCRWLYTKNKIREDIEKSGLAPSEYSGKKYLLQRDGNKCSVCELKQWMNKSIPLVLDHINGHADDNRICNLRLLCCNCDAQTSTYKSKNKGNGRRSRRKVN